MTTRKPAAGKLGVNEAGRRQLIGYLSNERQSQDATRDWIMTWLDTWCPVDPELIARVMKKVKGIESRAKKGGKRGK